MSAVSPAWKKRYNAKYFQANKARIYARNRAWRKHNRASHLAAIRAWKKRNPERVREYERKRLYGLTSFEFYALRVKQGDACAICERAFGPLELPHVDHDHATGAVRGLLCRCCNRAIGLLRDRPEDCDRAAIYLRGQG